MTDEWFFLQAGKLIANLIVLGSGVLLRAVSQAYRQAIVSECLSLSLSLSLSLCTPHFLHHVFPFIFCPTVSKGFACKFVEAYEIILEASLFKFAHILGSFLATLS
jgi:hypothetical protein